MTNRELIELLSTFPPDAVVVYAFHSETAVLREDEVDLFTPDTDKKMILYNGNYINWKPYWWPEDAPPPEFATVVYLPGN